MGVLLDDVDGVAELMGKEYLEAQLKNNKILLQSVKRAILFFTSGEGAKGIQSYTIDTGQDKQVVTRAELGSLYNMQRNLENDIAAMEWRLSSAGARRIVPRF